MRVSKEKAAENRERILAEAARLFRERGSLGVGVDALAEAAGFTHGSLYSQFGSKGRLLAEALRHGHARALMRSGGVENLSKSLSAYLSATHRDNCGGGCFMAALACEMPRQSKEVRQSFTAIVRSNWARLTALLPAGRKRQRQDDGLAMLATMVGALVLARAVDDPGSSDRILSAGRAHLLGKVREISVGHSL